MIYLFDHKILFYHIPKTAGASISRWLQQPAVGAHALIEPIHMLPWRVKKYSINPDWSFCVVRNPWDRWVSWWWYWRYIAQRFETSFEEYTERYFAGEYEGQQGGQYSMCAPQVWHSIACDSILRYENLQEDFKVVQDKLNLYIPLRKTSNISKGKQDYRTYYTPRLIDVVSAYYEDDIKELGYSYE